ncbi:MAG TPA: hypothetical protein VFG89_10885 [Coriobacteriia bacterium]|nr:hypothetical protein [Coriobacteriia bacterium]
MGQLVTDAPLATRWVPILLTILLASAGAVACVIGEGSTTDQRSWRIMAFGVVLIALAVPASALGVGTALAWLVGVSFAMITASVVMIVGLTMFAYAR